MIDHSLGDMARNRAITEYVVCSLRTDVHEYMVVGSTCPGTHPGLDLKRTISASFPMDVPPAKVAVYAMGVDNPARAEVAVGTQTPAVTTQARAVSTQAPQTGSATSAAPAEATAWSNDFVLQDALSSATTELRAAEGFHHPDIGLPFDVVAVGAQIGGFTGVFVKVKTA